MHYLRIITCAIVERDARVRRDWQSIGGKLMENMPQNTPFAKGAHCPICMKWLQTSLRLRMHLAYIPSSGGPNPCFQAPTTRSSGSYNGRCGPPPTSCCGWYEVGCFSMRRKTSLTREEQYVELPLSKHGLGRWDGYSRALLFNLPHKEP